MKLQSKINEIAEQFQLNWSAISLKLQLESYEMAIRTMDSDKSNDEENVSGNQKNAPKTLSKMMFSHSGNTQKNRTIKIQPIQPQIWVNFADGFLPVIIS